MSAPTEEPTSDHPERVALYRLYGADGQLLYVGITNNPKLRWQAHARDKSWWGEVARKDVEWFERRKSAERIEKTEIEDESPVYNLTFNGDRQRHLQDAEAQDAQDASPYSRAAMTTPDPLSIYFHFPQ